MSAWCVHCMYIFIEIIVYVVIIVALMNLGIFILLFR